jgi:glyoxylase-like metal-dependent hydrolase (beta-lactamase superfamily II)
MLQVKQIVNNIFTSNTWMLFDDCYDYCWLVDIGDYEKVAGVLPPGIEVRGLLLTHTHFDHTYGINALHEAHPECRVYTAEYGKIALYDDKKNFSKYHEASFTYNGDDVEVLNGGDQIEIFPGTILTAYATPGHCPSSLTYVVENWIFTGDAYIPGVKVVTKLPHGNRLQAKQSIEKILKLSEGMVICAGHGDAK